jgi:putative tryptophan/tyrosine transport system substrate-binding protein
MKRRAEMFQPPMITLWQRMLATGILLFLVVAPSPSSEVVIVISADLPPYRQAQEALTTSLTSEHCQVVTLEQITTDSSKLSTNADCVVAIGSAAAIWLHERKSPIPPLIYCMVSDPLTAGLQKTPVTMGVSTDIPPDQQIQLITETLPQARIIGRLYRQADQQSREAMESARALLPQGWKLETVAIDLQESPAAAIDLLLSRNVDVVWTTPDTAIWNEATVRSLLLTTLRRRVPVFGFSTAFVRAGALLGVGLEPATQGKQAAALVRDVLNKKTMTNAVTAPIFDLSLNLVVAQKLSLTLPPTVVQRAKHIFQPGR